MNNKFISVTLLIFILSIVPAILFINHKRQNNIEIDFDKLAKTELSDEAKDIIAEQCKANLPQASSEQLETCIRALSSSVKVMCLMPSNKLDTECTKNVKMNIFYPE